MIVSKRRFAMHLPSVVAIFTIAMVANCQTTSTTPTPAPAPPVTLDGPYQVRYATNLNAGESYIHIVNTGLNGAPVSGPNFGGSTGNICVNMYVIDPNEELIGCCSCMVTPNQTVILGVNQNFLGAKNSLPAVESALTIKLLGSNPGAANCNNSAGQVTTSTLLAGGYIAFGTTLHSTPISGVFNETEGPFLPVRLLTTDPNSELVSLSGRCASLQGNSPAFGVCASCRPGAAAAAPKHY